jgi:hypothetical protein
VVILQTLPPDLPEEEIKVKKQKPPTIWAPSQTTSIRAPKVKQEPKVKLEPKTSPVQSISRKRSFSIALGKAVNKANKIEPDCTTTATGFEEAEVVDGDLQELLDSLLVPKEEDRVAHRIRRRHVLQQEDIDCSVEFGILILAKREGST